MSILNKFTRLLTGTNAPQESVKADTPMSEYERYHQNYKEADRRYGKYVNQHISNIENIKTTYSVARDLYGFNSPEMEHVINMCIEDIGIADYVAAHSDLLSQGKPNYYTFTRLAIIHEKRGEIEQAINVCKLAIEKGFDSDDNGTKIQARLARLIKKQRNQAEKLESDT